MPVRPLPGDPNLGQMKNHAKALQRFVRAGVPESVELVREFHPRLATLTSGETAAAGFSRADAQLVIARQYGFASWARLRAHLQVVERFSRAPHRQPPMAAEEDLADQFLRLACLTHGDDDPARWRQAARLLAGHPELATASIHTAAAAGHLQGIRYLLEHDPSAAGQEGGPHHWEPLLYLAYSTIDDSEPGRSHLQAARLLLDGGADPGAGYLWAGLPSPYTALTGAFGTREAPHSQPLELARLLLERGADPNDSQALYELRDDDDHASALALLFEFGLGAGSGGTWHARLAAAHPTPAQLVEDELLKAAAGDWPDRLRLVLDHGVDLTGHGTNHRIFEGLTAYELAILNASGQAAALLEAAGARPDPADPVLDFLGACMRADRPAIDRLLAGDPAIVERAIAGRPHQISVAADKDRLEAVRLMAGLGFDVNAADRYPHQQTALHGAAFNGNLEMARFLVEHGADPAIEDCSFHSTPAGWAEHNDQQHILDYLTRLSRPGA